MPRCLPLKTSLLFAGAASAPSAALAGLLDLSDGVLPGAWALQLLEVVLTRSEAAPREVIVRLLGLLPPAEERELAGRAGPLPPAVLEHLASSPRKRTLAALAQRDDLGAHAIRLAYENARRKAGADGELVRQLLNKKNAPSELRIDAARAGARVSTVLEWARRDPVVWEWLLPGRLLGALAERLCGKRYSESLLSLLTGPVPTWAHGALADALEHAAPASIASWFSGTPVSSEAFRAGLTGLARRGDGLDDWLPAHRFTTVLPLERRPLSANHSDDAGDLLYWADADGVAAAHDSGVSSLRRFALRSPMLDAGRRHAAVLEGSGEDLAAVASNAELSSEEVDVVLDRLQPAGYWRLFWARHAMGTQRARIMSTPQAAALLMRYLSEDRAGEVASWLTPEAGTALLERDDDIVHTAFGPFAHHLLERCPELAARARVPAPRGPHLERARREGGRLGVRPRQRCAAGRSRAARDAPCRVAGERRRADRGRARCHQVSAVGCCAHTCTEWRGGRNVGGGGGAARVAAMTSVRRARR